MSDCGDSSCRYAAAHTGMRTNGGCRCDVCKACGANLTRPGAEHRHRCETPEWQSPWMLAHPNKVATPTCCACGERLDGFDHSGYGGYCTNRDCVVNE